MRGKESLPAPFFLPKGAGKGAGLEYIPPLLCYIIELDTGICKGKIFSVKSASLGINL